MKQLSEKMKQILIFLLTLALLLTVTAAPVTTFAGEKTGNIVNIKDKKYSYSDMETDLKQFAKTYPDIVSLESLGKTADKRKIYCLRMGNPDAKKQIIVQAGIHAREWPNCQMLMKSIERYLVNYKTGKYNKMTYKEIFDQVAVYVIPMVNPDGVTISQYGVNKIKDKKLRKKVKKMKRYGGYTRWKANARGVDLNRNFPASWGRKKAEKKPASEGYPGKKAKSEKETKAVLKLIKQMPNLKACINIHSRGELIYWGAKGNGTVRKNARKLAKAIKKTNGYRLVDETKTYGAGGDLERYLIAKKKIPYVCIETGKESCPLKHKSFSGIYKKNKTVIEKTARLYCKPKK